jgi:tetratricopeptide (TPR) repeat protein|tara:strand:- start:1862 stop:2965 length:1104 start_codon:yes stop_codon:yes gene_type:complete
MKMKKLILFISLAFMGGCANKALTEQQVKDFVIDHLENQVNYDEALEGFLNGVSDNAVTWSNPVWKNTPREFNKEGWTGEGFYEDSLVVDVHDILIAGDNSHVFGTAKYFIGDVVTAYRNFSGLVGQENDRLVWKRFLGIDNSNLAKGFLWPSNNIDGGLSPYNDMRFAMMNLNNQEALRLSDSLVAADPEWATAHLGQLHSYSMSNNEDKMSETLELALSKCDGASTAEQHFIKSYMGDKAEGRRHLELAMMLAPDDPMIRCWYAWGEKDNDLAIELLQHAWDRLPENSGVNNMIAYKYMNKGDMEMAAKHLEIYARVHPELPNVYDTYGDYYVKLGDIEKAKESYMKAYELDNNWTASKERSEAL